MGNLADLANVSSVTSVSGKKFKGAVRSGIDSV